MSDSFMFASLAEEWVQGLVSGCGSKPKAVSQPVNDCSDVIFWTNDVKRAALRSAR
jgi:hypothetical protein